MRKILIAGVSASALLLTSATPAIAAPNERACENGHGVLVAHSKVPKKTQGNHQAHQSIPAFCGYQRGH